MIFEAILGVTALPERAARFAPMGACILREAGLDKTTLRPFASSRTGALLRREGRGVLNFTDDILLFAQTALTDAVPSCEGAVLEGACEWWEIIVESAEREDKIQKDGKDRWMVHCRILAKHRARPFSPFNRGKNAALEAVILVTRSRLEGFDRAALPAKMRELRSVVEKTGGEREVAAFDLIQSKL